MTAEQAAKITEKLLTAANIPNDRRTEVERKVRLTGRAAEIRCHRKDIPEEMEDVVEMMCEDLLRADGIITDGNGSGAVASITRGDTSISYRDDSAVSLSAMRIAKDYDAMLIHFKKMNLPKEKEEK